MTDEQTMTRKEFPNGDVAVDEGNGLVYQTADAAYNVEVDFPQRPLSDEPYGVDLVRTTRDAHGDERQQRLTLAEYRSQMGAEEHAREVEQTLLEHGRVELEAEMHLVSAMPYETDEPLYLVGLYPPAPDADSATLNVLRLDGDLLDIAPVARGPVAEMATIEQRLFAAQAEGDVDVFLKAATAEAVRSQTLAPHTPLFGIEGVEVAADKSPALESITIPAWEDHPDWPDLSAWDQPPTPRPAALVLPVTFGEDMTPFDAQGRYVPHHHDEANTVHFFSVIDRPSDSPLPEDVSHELRYFRAHATEENIIMHDSQPVMPVADPDRSPWPLPALNLYLEDGDLAAAQSLARNTAGDHDLPFPDQPPPLGPDERQLASESGWYHFDAALVSATPQGVDDGYSVGVVDVYANHENGQWAARWLPMGEFDTLDEALSYQQQTLLSRVAEDRESAFSPAGFNDSPAIYERIALAEADAALTDLLEQNDGHYPPDYEGDHEPAWEPLTSKEWDAYRDHMQTVADIIPDAKAIRENLPTATPPLADDALISASIQPDAPYLQAEDFVFEDFKPEEVAPTWQLAIVPAHDPDGEPLGYSAICVIDFTDLAEAVSPDAPQRAQWLEVAQFQTEDRAQRFHKDFMSLVGNDELGNITGPALAGVIADDLETDSQWQTMDQLMLEKLKADKWSITHSANEWKPRLDEVSPTPAIGSTTKLDLDL